MIQFFIALDTLIPNTLIYIKNKNTTYFLLYLYTHSVVKQVHF
jgi:hypothetical protein